MRTAQDGSAIRVILMCGNVVDGMSFHGPFDNEDDAESYATDNGVDEWTTAPLMRFKDGASAPSECWAYIDGSSCATE